MANLQPGHQEDAGPDPAAVIHALAREGFGYRVLLVGHRAKLPDRFRQRHHLDLLPPQRSDVSPLRGMCRIHRRDSEPGCEHAVERGWRTAALDVTQDRRAGLEARPLLDL